MEKNKLSTLPQAGFWTILSIGVGGMVGGGIFAVIGLSATMAHGATPLAFVIAGLVALLTSYSYAKLSIRYPSRGGTVEFLNQAFGPTLLTGAMNVLMVLSYIVMLALYAYAFASYGIRFFPESEHVFLRHVFITGIILLLTGINVISTKLVLKSELYINIFKVVILVAFVVAGIASVDTQHFVVAAWSSPLEILASGMIIFVSYEGFELIANASENVKDPKKNLPRAYYLCVSFVIVLYFLIAIVAVGHLTIPELERASDYALAASAKSFFGNFGFTLVAIAALLATSSAINASLYGSARISYILAKEGELPRRLMIKIWNRPIMGLLIVAAATLIVANFFDLKNISTMGSAGFLMVFAAVNGANLKLRRQTKSRLLIPLLGLLACLSALGVIVLHSILEASATIWVLIHMVLLAFSLEWIYRRGSRRHWKFFAKPPSALQ